jgi:hypothetical protein
MLSREKRYALMFAGDLRYRTQQVQGKLGQHRSEHIVLCEFKILYLRSKKRLHRGKFLSNGHTDKFHQNRAPPESFLSSSSTS